MKRLQGRYEVGCESSKPRPERKATYFYILATYFYFWQHTSTFNKTRKN